MSVTIGLGFMAYTTRKDQPSIAGVRVTPTRIDVMRRKGPNVMSVMIVRHTSAREKPIDNRKCDKAPSIGDSSKTEHQSTHAQGAEDRQIDHSTSRCEGGRKNTAEDGRSV